MIWIKEVSQYKFFSFKYKRDNKRVFYLIIAEGKVSRHDNFAKYVEAVFYRCSTKFTRKHQCRSLFLIKLKAGGLKPATLLIKRLRHRRFLVKFAKLWRHLFYKTTVDDCFWIYQNINCHKVSVSTLIISTGRTRREK